MLSCRDTTRLLSDAQDQPLPFGKRLGLRLHLMMCHLCRRYIRQLRLLDVLIGGYAATAEETHSAVLSPEARDRIRDSLRD